MTRAEQIVQLMAKKTRLERVLVDAVLAVEKGKKTIESTAAAINGIEPQIEKIKEGACVDLDTEHNFVTVGYYNHGRNEERKCTICGRSS